MSFSGLTVSVSGIDSITKKKLKLYREVSRVQLFFVEKPDLDRSLCVLPVVMLPHYFSSKVPPAILRPPVVGFGPPEAMSLSLSAGCVDYLCNPWSSDEFFNRIDRALLGTSFRHEDLRFFNPDGELCCIVNDSLHRIRLSKSEELIIKIFSRNPGVYFSRQVLSELLSGNGNDESRAVDMYISRLRKKITALCSDAGKLPGGSPIRTASSRGWGIL